MIVLAQAKVKTIYRKALLIVLALMTASNAHAVMAGGGNITNTIGDYRIHIFTNSGTLTVLENGLVRVLAVGGGGGGGGGIGGGGGGGGVVYEDAYPVVAGESIAVTVGDGGPGGSGTSGRGANGGNSAFGSLTAYGGGGGGSDFSSGLDGGSGGGCGYNTTPGAAVLAGAQGRNGGTTMGVGGNYPASGGGGAGTAGGSVTNSAIAGDGGSGLQFDISGTPAWYGGGGGGGTFSGGTRGRGGLGGGGDGGSTTTGAPTNGVPNTGGGGGGQRNDDGGAAASGGSGIVIVKYLAGSVWGYRSEPRAFPVKQWMSIASNDVAAFRRTDRLEAKCRHSGEPNWPITRGFFSFDLAGLANGSAVTSAALWIYLKETGSPNDYEVYGAQLHCVNSAWSNSAADLYSQGTTALTNFAKSTPGTYLPPALGWYKVDATTTVSNWYTGAASNCGFMVRIVQEGPYDYVIRGFEIVGGRAPRLVVKAANARPVRFVTTNIAADAYRTIFSDGVTRTDEIRCGNVTVTNENPRGYFRFTLPEMPVTRYRFVGAGLKLYVEEVTSPSYGWGRLYRVTTPWATNDVEYGEDMAYVKNINRTSSEDPPARATGWLPFEARDVVQAWLDGSATNHGFCSRTDEGAVTYTKRKITPAGTNAPMLSLTFEELPLSGSTFMIR